LNQPEEARAAVAEVLRLQPNYTISGTTRRIAVFKHAKDEKLLVDGLRRAGLPE
jgi:adenylate cyclase